jgi:hypothetical protein
MNNGGWASLTSGPKDEERRRTENSTPHERNSHKGDEGREAKENEPLLHKATRWKRNERKGSDASAKERKNRIEGK